MGMNNFGSMRFIVDIETVPVGDVEQYFDPVEPVVTPDLSLISPAKNLVDPVKIAADIQKRQEAAMESYYFQCHQQETKRRELVERCALDLDLCRVVAVGYMREDESEPEVATCVTEQREAGVLRVFWDELDNRVTIGYSHLQFDLPVLARRSLYLDVPAPVLNLDKYRSPHTDLQQRLSLNGTKPYRSLNWYCKRFGLDVPNDGSTGKDIGQLVADGNWEQVAAHCRADVLKTRALAQRMGVLHQQPVEMVL